VSEDSIDAITSLPSLESIQRDSNEDIGSLLSKTAVLKLNGGLGTSMGLETAKSLLPVKNGKTFLDLIAEQIKYTRKTFGSHVRFILMNSFSTSSDTRDFLSKKHPDLLEEPDIELMQNSSCKVDAETLGPVSFPENPDMEWYVLYPYSSISNALISLHGWLFDSGLLLDMVTSIHRLLEAACLNAFSTRVSSMYLFPTRIILEQL
jgi:UDP-N-acetylglucosamine pyrophosphorylase